MSLFEFPLVYVTFISTYRVVGLAWWEYISLPECQNTFSLTGGDMRKWHSLSCSCPNKHYVFNFVYFNIKKVQLLQTHSFWAIQLTFQSSFGMAHLTAMQFVVYRLLRGVWIQSRHSREMCSGLCIIYLNRGFFLFVTLQLPKQNTFI